MGSKVNRTQSFDIRAYCLIPFVYECPASPRNSASVNTHIELEKSYPTDTTTGKMSLAIP